jgi:hypothetical protein
LLDVIDMRIHPLRLARLPVTRDVDYTLVRVLRETIAHDCRCSRRASIVIAGIRRQFRRERFGQAAGQVDPLLLQRRAPDGPTGQRTVVLPGLC